MDAEKLFDQYKDILSKELGEEPKVYLENGNLKIFKGSERNFVLFGSEFLHDLEEFAAPIVRLSSKEYLKEVFEFYEKKTGDKEKTMKALFSVISVLTGWGIAEELSRDDSGAKVRVYNSFESQAYVRRGEKSSKPVCVFLQGIFHGLYESYFEKDVSVKETLCAATGAPYCEFEIKVK